MCFWSFINRVWYVRLKVEVGYLGWGVCMFILFNDECWGIGGLFVSICECVRMIFAYIGREIWWRDKSRSHIRFRGVVLLFVFRGQI